MAQQKGILPLKGTIGNLTFYKSKDGYLARKKEEWMHSVSPLIPLFSVRENGAEFGRAGKAGKLLRNAIRAFTQKASDGKMVGRLTKAMIQVIQADVTNARGLQNVIDGEAELLTGFEFNINAQLSSTLYAPFTTTIDRVAGTLAAAIPAFVPVNMIAAPQGATHYRLNIAGVEIDFEGNTYVAETSSTEDLPWDNVLTGAISLETGVTPNSTHPLFLVLGIEFAQEETGPCIH